MIGEVAITGLDATFRRHADGGVHQSNRRKINVDPIKSGVANRPPVDISGGMCKVFLEQFRKVVEDIVEVLLMFPNFARELLCVDVEAVKLRGVRVEVPKKEGVTSNVVELLVVVDVRGDKVENVGSSCGAPVWMDVNVEKVDIGFCFGL